MVGFISSGLILFVLVVLGQLFEPLPNVSKHVYTHTHVDILYCTIVYAIIPSVISSLSLSLSLSIIGCLSFCYLDCPLWNVFTS